MPEQKKTKSGSSTAFGFHITKDNGKLRGSVKPEIGSTYQSSGPIRICNNGMHASHTLAEASIFRFVKPGRYVSLVKLTGEIEEGENKIVARNRKVLAMLKIEGTPPTVEKTVNTGLDVHTYKAVDPKWFEEMEEKLHAMYARSKRSVDANTTVVVLPENERE